MTLRITPRELPEPPGIETTLRAFNGAVFGFSDQAHLAEAAATTQTAGARVVGVSLSYTYYRDPLRHEDPVNFVDLTSEQVRAIEQAEASTLPDWLVKQITRIRYPTLWEAVRTTKAAPRDSKNALAILLTAHANDVLRTNNPTHVPMNPPRPATVGRVSPADLLESVTITIDGEPQRGRRLDCGPHTVALGARVDNRYVTVVYDRRIAPGVRVELTSHCPR